MRVVGKGVMNFRVTTGESDGMADGISVGSGVRALVGLSVGTRLGDRVGASVMGSTQISSGWKSSKQPLIYFRKGEGKNEINVRSAIVATIILTK